MKIGKIVTGGMFAGLIVLSNIISIPVKATPLKPDWMDGDIRGGVIDGGSAQSDRCSLEHRKIKPAGLRRYDDTDPNTTRQLCVYKNDGFQYARYTRAFYIDPFVPGSGVVYESGVAFANNDSDQTMPSRTSGDNLDRLYAGDTSNLFVYQSRNTYYALTLRLYNSPLQHMVINSDGFLKFKGNDNGYYPLTNSQGVNSPL